MNEPTLPELPDGDVDTPMGNEAWTREQMRAYARAAVLAERERLGIKADEWSKASALKLRAGEMTAQELRTAQAVARGIAASIREGV